MNKIVKSIYLFSLLHKFSLLKLCIYELRTYDTYGGYNIGMVDMTYGRSIEYLKKIGAPRTYTFLEYIERVKS